MRKKISKNKSGGKGKKNKDDEEVDEGTKEIREDQEKDAENEEKQITVEESGANGNNEQTGGNADMDFENNAKTVSQDQELDL